MTRIIPTLMLLALPAKTAIAAQCTSEQLENILKGPVFAQDYETFKISVGGKYAPWTTRVEDSRMGLNGDNSQELLRLGNEYALEVTNNVQALFEKVHNAGEITCRQELIKYIEVSEHDFKKFHVNFLVDQKLINPLTLQMK